MKNNNKGMTIIEVLVAMVIMSIVIGLVYGVYILNTKIISKNEIKTMIQTDAQYIQSTITNIGMQSSGIDSIEYEEAEDSEGYYEVENIDLKMKENGVDYIYRFSIDNNIFTMSKIGQDSSVIQNNILSENVESFRIKPISFDEDDLTTSKSIDVYFKLGKKKGFSDVEYDISTLINFRNK